MFLELLPLLALAGLYFVPVHLLRRQAHGRAQEFFVSAGRMPAGVIANASIAYGLRLALFGPFFALGAAGAFWPALIGAAALGLGLSLLYGMRRPMLAFLREALTQERSFTVHAFIARRNGDDSRVRALAASLSVVALFGLVAAEAVAAAALLKPVLTMSALPNWPIAAGLLLLAVLYALPSGNAGVMWSTQAQLGLIYFGLFGATALLLYLSISALRPFSAQAVMSMGGVALICAAMLCYRRSRYSDTSRIGIVLPGGQSETNGGREPLSGRLFRRLQKLLNPFVTALLVLVIVLSGMGLSAKGLPELAQAAGAALGSWTSVPALALATIVLLALLYPAVDLANWQRIAAYEIAAYEKEETQAGGADLKAFRAIIRLYAAETPLIALFMCLFGALAMMTTPGSPGADAMLAFVRRLGSQQNWVAAGAFWLLLVSVVLIAFSTMISGFSAGLCAIRYDLAPALWPELAPESAEPADEARAIRRSAIAACGFCFLLVALYFVADAYWPIAFASAPFLALLVALSCCQLALAPVLFGPVLFGSEGAGVTGPWALAVIGASAATGAGAVIVFFATGIEAWLWSAVPACVGSGAGLFGIARLSARAGV